MLLRQHQLRALRALQRIRPRRRCVADGRRRCPRLDTRLHLCHEHPREGQQVLPEQHFDVRQLWRVHLFDGPRAAQKHKLGIGVGPRTAISTYLHKTLS